MTDHGHSIRTALIDRDPGDETPAVPLQRSYRATYELNDPIRLGSILYRDFIGPDGFLHAVELAERTREDGWRLLNVRELT